MAKIIIFGATDLAMLSHFYFAHDTPHEVCAFTVDRAYIKETTFCGLPVVPFETIEGLYPPSEYKMFVAIWFGRVNRNRAEKYLQVKQKGYELISYVSSKSSTWPALLIGDNCLVSEGSVISPFVKIGDNVIVAGGVVGHDSVIGDHCFIASHAVVLGRTTVGPYCILGANCTIRHGVNIARECIIGPGVSITSNTQERGVYTGNPPELLPKPSNVLSRW